MVSSLGVTLRQILWVLVHMAGVTSILLKALRQKMALWRTSVRVGETTMRRNATVIQCQWEILHPAQQMEPTSLKPAKDLRDMPDWWR